MTLVCGEIEVQGNHPHIDDEGVDFRYPTFPAVKIARLAVDARYRGLGLGEGLVSFGLGLVKDQICPRVGCRFVVVDSKHESVNFYLNQGFTLLDTPANHARSEPIMFIDMRKISL
jgi:GNAT superfamily N-acetyltransferase